jgi:hypothetical protein
MKAIIIAILIFVAISVVTWAHFFANRKNIPVDPPWADLGDEEYDNQL